MMSIPVILDTDIGTDVDDCLALALLLSSPELELQAVTCVYGDTALRSRMALKLLQLRGLTDIPVYAGATKPLTSQRPIYWEGHEGQGLIEQAADLQPTAGFAPDVIVQQVMSNPGKIHIIAIGPLTNIALALKKEPRVAANLAHLTIMGGVVRSIDRLDLPLAEHNIVCDPEAARIVLESGAPITLVPLDITTQVEVTEAGLKQIQAAGSPFQLAVADQLARYPRFQRYGRTNLHDPLAVGVVIDPTLVTLQKVVIQVATSDDPVPAQTLMRLLSGNETASIELATRVDTPRFEAFFIDRVSN
ncbi:MAG: nucleoside hydrolase [Anaerolineae bacterium]|nr:nucleoside hydrolase [Anaerolineae bacterium]